MEDVTLTDDSSAMLPRSPELMKPEDTALLMVDMQDRLLAAVRQAEQITWNCRRLLDAATILDVRIAATEQNPDKLGRTAPTLSERLPETPLAKMTFSCRGCSELGPRWRDAGIERVLLCGVETHVCVQQTAFDLLAAGYHVYVAADAVGSRNWFDHETALRRMDSAGAAITTTEAALFEWCQRAGTPEFRRISELAKEAGPPPGR